MRDDVNSLYPAKQRPFRYTPPAGAPEYQYIDDDVLVLRKPYGLLTTEGKPDHHKDCLARRVQADYASALAVHRLDHSTSGLVIFSRTADTFANLTEQFRKKRVAKTYIANVWGLVEKDEGEVDLPLRKNWQDVPRQLVCHERGKPAKTHWKVRKRDQHSTLIELYPETGRTHQLRMHMMSLSHPILGDELYAHDEAYNAATRLLLHATRLEFAHPSTKEKLDFSWPAAFDT